jgi:myo-inositol-1(or 4)-monophosphatase
MAFDYLSISIMAARAAGSIILEHLGEAGEIRHKGKTDLVTETDILCEKTIYRILSDAFPDIGFLSEEGTSDHLSGDMMWVVDPLDGTTNFAHSYPHVAISIALTREGAPDVAVVYNPFLKELFHAELGKGAYLNGNRIYVSNVDSLKDALLATGFPYRICEKPELPLEVFCAIVPKAQGIRRAGAAALDLCYVASGRVDGFWELGLKPWDTAAGALLIREAGGEITDGAGSPYSSGDAFLLASNGKLHEELLSFTSKTATAEKIRQWCEP